MKEIEDGACLQLGIGGLPNVIGSMIAESDLKDLGVHTEMLVDSMVDLYNEGKITGNSKTIDRFKMVYTFAMGTKKLYEFLHNNPACASYPVNYTNDPRIIAVNSKVMAINNAIEIDLFSQVCSESVGNSPDLRHRRPVRLHLRRIQFTGRQRHHRPEFHLHRQGREGPFPDRADA